MEKKGTGGRGFQKGKRRKVNNILCREGGWMNSSGSSDMGGEEAPGGCYSPVWSAMGGTKRWELERKRYDGQFHGRRILKTDEQ